MYQTWGAWRVSRPSSYGEVVYGRLWCCKLYHLPLREVWPRCDRSSRLLQKRLSFLKNIVLWIYKITNDGIGLSTDLLCQYRSWVRSTHYKVIYAIFKWFFLSLGVIRPRYKNICLNTVIHSRGVYPYGD